MDQALLDRVQKQSWFHKYPRGWPFLLFVIASVGTAVSVMAIERADQQTRQVELDRNLTEISSALQRRVTENIALLRAASALFAMQDQVTQAQFQEFAGDLQANGNLYGSLGLGWAPLVSASRLPFFEVARQEQGMEYTLALDYLNKAIALGGDTYYFYRVKSLVEAALLDYRSAIKSAQKSMDLAGIEGKDEFVRMNQENIKNWNTVIKN